MVGYYWTVQDRGIPSFSGPLKQANRLPEAEILLDLKPHLGAGTAF